MWTLGRDQPVIPGVPFIRWAMALPYRTTGSLRPGFPPAWPVSLAVKLPYAIALFAWFPIRLREPLSASVTFWEATAPVKLPTTHCFKKWAHKNFRDWYFMCVLIIYLRRNLLTTSQIFYTLKYLLQYVVIVKVHGVFPSSRGYSASSRRIQFHWTCAGDSGTVVTPFMQDTN